MLLTGYEYGTTYVSVMAVCKGKDLTALRIWAIICLAAMLIGPVGTALLPKTVFGLFERFGTFSVVVFNAVLGMNLMNGTQKAFFKHALSQ